MPGEGFGRCESKETLEIPVLNFLFQTTGCSLSLPVKVEGTSQHVFAFPRAEIGIAPSASPLQGEPSNRLLSRQDFLFLIFK